MSASAEPVYVAIDLKSFYASVECVERGLDPLAAMLAVADVSRTEKTICLAVSPALKALGISGRPRLFEVEERLKAVNAGRRRQAPRGRLRGETTDVRALAADPSLAAGYIAATPQMALYMEYSTRVYNVYRRFVAPEDIHVYSIDEVFMDLTPYRRIYRMPPRELVSKIISEVLAETGITATAGIGGNLYLAKVAMDIVAKKMPPDADGARIAELDETGFRRQLWTHRPLTDFWRLGRGYAAKLEKVGLYTMGDIARCSLGKKTDFYNEDLLYSLFGVNAELLIDHAWGWEPCTLAAIKAYKPRASSLNSGQVLQCPYPHDRAALVVREMADALALDLFARGAAAGQLGLYVGYDGGCARDPAVRERYAGRMAVDAYGRELPPPAGGSVNLEPPTSSAAAITAAADALFAAVADPLLPVRRINISAGNLQPESAWAGHFPPLGLFDREEELAAREAARAAAAKEKKIQRAVLDIKNKFGKNSLLKGMNLQEGSTAATRNAQIGGHKA